MRINRRSFWGLFAGLFTIPFLPKELPTFNKDEWVYHPLRREHQDTLLRYFGRYPPQSPYGTWKPFPYDHRTKAECIARGMFGLEGSS